jgi:transposase
MKHKSDDYKTIAVKYYLNNKDSMDKVCKIFNCKKSTLKDWIDRYKNTKHFTRKNRKAESYKINKEQVNHALSMIDRNEQLTMGELLIDMKQKHNNLDITSQHLGSIISIILDNARSHHNDMVKDAILKSGNKYLFSVPYNPETNSLIESYFNQIKTHIKKNRDVYTFEGLEKNVDKAIDKVKPENYKNYFKNAYGIKDDTTYNRKTSTRKCKLKKYKS